MPGRSIDQERQITSGLAGLIVPVPKLPVPGLVDSFENPPHRDHGDQTGGHRV